MNKSKREKLNLIWEKRINVINNLNALKLTKIEEYLPGYIDVQKQGIIDGNLV